MEAYRYTDLFLPGGRPTLIVSIVEASEGAICNAAKQIALSGADVVEWRVDRYKSCRNSDQVISMIEKLRSRIGSLPILLTIRTSHEGGDWHPSSEEYRDAIADICTTRSIDFIDIQYRNPEAKRCFKAAKAHSIPIIASHHDFASTPSITEMTDHLDAMAAMGADICKIAVTPRTNKDVITALETARQWTLTSTIPAIVISMGSLGTISRLAGYQFGSCATYTCLPSTPAAPGQLTIDQTRMILDILETDS